MYYPVHLDLAYSNDAEYRAAVRKLMSMQCNAAHTATMDAVTADELDIDPDAMTVFLDFVYHQTQNDNTCMALYRLAAATMFSEDPTIGLAVLCSYSYLREFHQAMRTFFLNIQSEDNPALQALIAQLSR